MGANLRWGKGFTTVENQSTSGVLEKSRLGIAGGFDILSWTSVREMQSLAKQHGVDEDEWPVYSEETDGMEVPIEEAEALSIQLRASLEHVDPHVIEGSYWLRTIHRLLQEGNVFYIVN